ncbi:MAG: CDP-glycerol glycerophosphotransferase family protein [Planctomycetes bacterium]|nr:CDP-glycerol glycerophosphotransferase family protein [Planctomycetota bacterium]
MKKRILFSGSAWVHFACVHPVYRRLADDPRLEFWLTGGFKKGEDSEEATYVQEGFYEPFGVDQARVIPVEVAAERDFDVLVAAHKSPVQPRSVGKSVQVFHGVSFKNLGVREKYLKFDHLCLAGRYHGEAYRRKGFVREPGQCLITGVPKMDALVSGTLDRNALLRRNRVDPARPTILYAPTGSKFNSMETMGRRVIEEIQRDGRWNLLVKLHDHPKNTDIDWAGEIRRMESDRIRLVTDADVVPHLHAADLLLTDASSVSVEYSLLDRPIVFLDVPELLRDVVDRGGALDLDTHGRKAGVVVGAPEGVVGAIADSFAHPGRGGEERRAMARDIFHDPGRATDRVTGVVLYAAGLAPSLPEGIVALEPDAKPLGVNS